MNIAGISFESIADGEGVRVVVFVSGCLHDCKGCHNPASHSFTAGRPFTRELQDEIVEYIKHTPFISGITLSGGDPMYSADELLSFVLRVKKDLPDVTVWIYTGFTFEEVMQNKTMSELLAICDVLVDGPFVLEQRDITLAYRGSSNQRIIDVQKTLSSGVISLLLGSE